MAHTPVFAASQEELTALQLADKGQYSRAMQYANRSDDPLIRPLATWLYLTHDKSSPAFGELTRFVYQYPHWPRQHIIKRKAEGDIDHGFAPSDDTLLEWFDAFPPLSDDGKFAYLKAMHGKSPYIRKAMENLRRYWRSGDFYTKQQEKLLAMYKGYLRPEDHIARLDTLIWNENYDRARQALNYVPGEYQLLGHARLNLALNRGQVDAAIAAVPQNLQNDPGLMYERIRWRRRKDRNSDALSLLNTYSGPVSGDHADKWWLERHILARRALEDGNHRQAYAIAVGHRQTEGFPHAQAEWLSGWLALNYLNQPGIAFKHFEKLFKNVSTPISKARGAYWAGVASAKKGYPDIARQWYKVAAQYFGTFYGQMAAAALEPDDALLKRGVQHAPHIPLKKDQLQQFMNMEFVRVVYLLHQAGLDEHIDAFMYHITDDLKTKEDYKLAAHLAQKVGELRSLLRIGKQAIDNNIFLVEAAFPVLPYSLQEVPHPALTHAIVRQESAFDRHATSRVGAKGLMQLMPATAREVSRRHRLRYSSSRLYSDPAYNLRLGQAYLAEMLERFDGSAPMAIAAYNAGPNRVAQWIKEFGDPRRQHISWIDWMETIPIYETRNYVQRVLEAERIYRYALPVLQAK